MKSNELWNNIGTVFYNPKDLTYEDDTILEKGTYLIADSGDDFYTLYDIKNNKNVIFQESLAPEDTEFTVVYTSPEDVVEMALDSMTKTVLQLTAEGWDIDPNNPYFDISPYITKLEILKALKDSLATHSITQ
jgi:hypothetical protein